MTQAVTLSVLLVDDEALARARLRTLLADCADPLARVDGEAKNATDALELLRRQRFDVVLLDIHMPGADGMTLAQAMRDLPDAPAVVFVTAHSEHALRAFELDALDYLTKPVRLERLQQALAKVGRMPVAGAATDETLTDVDVLVIQDRGRIERVPLREVLYLKAELKYITVRTAQRSYILDGALGELEERLGAEFLRVHRNALVSKRALRALEKHADELDGEGWAVRLDGVDELLAVSRRQLAAVREVIAA